ncbi:MAG TPA: HypC/HybG/HupF family hydrogenase formation chaperone [Lutibacter sp.]|nr:HypC/HybG/HupF family hydrogenase formation chaperone [Lutibacter sp.]
MCLSIPGKLIEIVAELDPTFRIGKVDFDGIKKDVNLAMVPEAKIGDYVLVHVGAAISVVDEEEARVTFDILMKLGETDELNMTEWTKEIIKKDIQRPSSPELNNETKKAKMNDDSPQENVWD